MDKLTKLEHLRSASRETKDLIGQVASTAAAAIEELADKKQDVITGKQGQVAGFDAAGNIVAQNSSGSGNGVSYSREETVVGSYNGKPLYSKIVFDNSVQMYSDTLVDVYFDIIEDVDAVVDITLTAKVLHGTNKNLVRWIKFPYVESGMSGYLKTSMSGSNTTQLVWVNLSGANPYRGDWWFKCTALYTKTTDDRYTVTVESSDQASGTVSGAGTYQQGTSVTVTAAPGEGYRFVKWTENGQTVSESTSYTFTVTGDRTLTAVFEESLYVSGVDWWAASLPSSGGWEKVTYGNGKFVTVNDKGKAAYSTDGISWTEVALPSSADWDGVAYGNGKFVAVANRSNKAAYSTDGITWTAATMPSSAGWYCVAYGNGKFVAIASGSASKIAAYSTDGITWTAVTLPSTTNWQSVTYGNGKFVAVGQGKAAYSTDGISWTDVTLPFKTWRSVAYGDGKFVTIPGESVEALYSTDGVTWAAATLPSAIYWQNVTYGGGKFVAVSTMSSNEAAYSTDGITWRAATMPSSAYWRCVTYGNGKFVAVAGSGNKAAYSSEKGPGV